MTRRLRIAKGHHVLGQGAGAQSITNTQIVAALGAETDFVLRAWFESAGRRSIESDQITVRTV